MILRRSSRAHVWRSFSNLITSGIGRTEEKRLEAGLDAAQLSFQSDANQQ
jgi:hypothetical protein